MKPSVVLAVLIGILVLACSSAAPAPLPTPIPLPTYTPQPTYTPLPTPIPQVIIREKVVQVIVTATPTATLIPTPTPTPRPTPTPKPYTEVGGMLRSNTTWGLTDSPYLVTKSVQIPEGITLTIEAGVEVQVDKEAMPFLVEGILRVNGSQMSPVYLRGQQGLFERGHIRGPTVGALIDINFAILEGFLWFYWGGTLGNRTDPTKIEVRDSVFRDIEDPSVFSEAQLLIERSRFENASGFKFNTDAGNNTFLFQNNCLVSKKKTVYPWIEFDDPPTPQLTVIQDNAFLDSGMLAFRAGKEKSSVPVLIGLNYYGTTDAAVIDQMVYDSSDDLGRGYRIIVTPILDKSPIADCDGD
jgi:hypothetical protein